MRLIIFDGNFKVKYLDKSLKYTVINFSAPYKEFEAFIKILKGDGITYNIVDFLSIYLEKQESLKQEYLKWVYDFSHQKFKNKNIRTHLAENGYSFWWNTLLAEKNVLKYDSTSIYDSLKLMLLEDIIKNSNYKSILVFSSRIEIVNTLRDLATDLNIDFRVLYSKPKINIKPLAVNNFFLSAFFFLYKEIKKRILIKFILNPELQDNSYLEDDKKQLSVLTYFPNIDIDVLKKEKRFVSRYWNGVHKVFESRGIVNYILWYIKSGQMNYREMLNSVNLLNKNSKNKYIIIETFVSIKELYFIVIKALFNGFVNKKLINKSLFNVNRRNLNLFYIHKREWRNSIYGYEYIQSQYRYVLFKSMSKKLNKQTLFYLMEMQGWEVMLNYICRQNEIYTFGVIHTIIKPMMLKYFNDLKVYSERGVKFKYELPSKVLVNGEQAKKDMYNQGISLNKLETIEAQRFVYLLDPVEDNVHNKDILIALSIDLNESKELLECFVSAYKPNMFNKVYIKAHPFLDIKQIISLFEFFPEYINVDGPMSKAFEKVSLVLVASSTSVLLESILNKKKTVTLLSLNKLALLAIEKHRLLFIATNAKSLQNIFLDFKYKKIDNYAKDTTNFSILCINNSLFNWHKLMKKYNL